MLFANLPPPGPTSPVTVECVQQAASTYGLPEALILAILQIEGGGALRDKAVHPVAAETLNGL